MKKTILLLMIVMLSGCQRCQAVEAPAVTTTARGNPPSPAAEQTDWSIYDPDPGHPWNRVFRELYRRVSAGGTEYGANELDPLLWLDTTHLLRGDSYRQAIQELDVFLSSHAETQIRDPLKRAMFQRDLWAVFDWLACQPQPDPAEREALEHRLAEIMKRVALPRDEILSLPDHYALTVGANRFPPDFQPDHPETAFLPPDLFRRDGAWVPMGRSGGPIAMTHTEAFPFFGRSAFLVFVRSPDGRASTLDFVESLNKEINPVTAAGTEVALVRRMLLIDDHGEPVLSPLIETIQIRHYSPVQSFYEFELDRERLFDEPAGALVPNDDMFLLFMGHGDVFEMAELPTLQAAIPDICKACHARDPSSSAFGSTMSIISYSREPFPLPKNERPVLSVTTWAGEARAVIEWKEKHHTWKSLQALWEPDGP